MKIIDLTQGTPEWLEWRSHGVGATAAAVIMGHNPWQKPIELWEEMCGFKDAKPVNSAMKHGSMNEPIARERTAKDLKREFVPICVEHDLVPQFRASLDGWNESTQCLIEIKCPISDKVLDACYRREFPEYWKTQIQWQAMICKPKKMYLSVWDYRVEKVILHEMQPDIEFHQEMHEKCKEFWECVRSCRCPDTNDDYVHLEGQHLEGLLFEYQILGEKKSAIEEQQKVLKELILDKGDGGNFKCSGFTVRQQQRKSLDEKAMMEAGIDLERYRKTGAIFWVIQCPRDKVGNR